MNEPENVVGAMEWFRPQQWPLLRALSADAENLEQTYEEWLEFVSRQIRELEAKGIRVQKIDVEVGALTRSRAEYALRGSGETLE